MRIAFARDGEGLLERKNPDPLGERTRGRGLRGAMGEELVDQNFARLPEAFASRRRG